MSKEGILAILFVKIDTRIEPSVRSLIFKEVRAKRFHPSKFVIRYSIFCGSLFYFCVVSHKFSYEKAQSAYFSKA